jgi:hypothetical protein
MGRIRLAIVLAALAACGALLALPAEGASVRIGTLFLRADGGFTPRLLPKHSFAPIAFQGHAEVKTTDGSMPPALQQVKLEFDRDGRLATAGLPVCPPSRIEAASPAQARRLCKGALVGTGHLGATIAVPGGGRIDVHSPLTLFNGPREKGNPTAVVHAQTSFPAVETYVVVVPIERRGGAYRYRAVFEVPPIAGGLGALTHIDAKIDRDYRSGGTERSYVSARCSDYILQTRGFFSFADGTIVSGSVFKSCRPLP